MLRTLQDFEKCAIGARDGDIGRVKDLYFDDLSWVIRYLIVDAGSWLASRKVLISPIAIRKPEWSKHLLPVAITRSQVENSPNIDTNQPVVWQHELRYQGYYGYPNYWGGTGLWGAGMYPFAMLAGTSEMPLGVAAQEGAIASGAAQQEHHRKDDHHMRSCEAVVGYHIQAKDGEVGHVGLKRACTHITVGPLTGDPG